MGRGRRRISYEFYIQPQHYSEAEANGITAHTLDQRVRYLAWKMDKAITTPARKRTNYGHWAKVAEANGIPGQTFRKRIKDYGYSIEVAATKPLLDKKNHMQKVQKETRWVKKGVRI